MTEVRSRRSLLTFLPLAAFLALAGFFLVQLMAEGDKSEVPSALIGHPAPATVLPPLGDKWGPGIDSAGFAGQVTLLNVFASWCVPCRDEHPFLNELSRDGRVRIIGLNYKDKTGNAEAFLAEGGNPYAAVGVDANGRAAIEWGVYGVPETFVIDRAGIIVAKIAGPIGPDNFATRLKPAIDKALAAD